MTINFVLFISMCDMFGCFVFVLVQYCLKMCTLNMLTSHCSLYCRYNALQNGVVFYTLLCMIGTIRRIPTYTYKTTWCYHTQLVKQKIHICWKKDACNQSTSKPFLACFVVCWIVCFLLCLRSSRIHISMLCSLPYIRMNNIHKLRAAAWWYFVTGGYLQQEQARSWFQINNNGVSKLNFTDCDSTMWLSCTTLFCRLFKGYLKYYITL